mmetsp:Transcript_43589/g.115208  ORF Transcript_43589/g.115208 Transcript_43589/m.115208 type:complete len:616 (+) Transcript_43589:68-1915(+)
MTRLQLFDVDTGDSTACAALARTGDACAVLSPASGDSGSLLLRWGELPTVAFPLRESYVAVFPREGAPAPFSFGPSFAESEAVRSGGDEQCFLVFFQIKPECVDAFRSLLADECVSVLAVEARMLRYDLYQSTDDPCRFVVLELAADAAAMAAHEARRADGTMRAALAQMEAVSRKAIGGTGPYAVQHPRPKDLAWPQEWREALVLGEFCGGEFLRPAVSFTDSNCTTKVAYAALQSTRRRRAAEWLTAHLGRDVTAALPSRHNKLGGMSGSFRFFRVQLGASGEEMSVALKTTAASSLKRSALLGNAREAHFYRTLAPSLGAAGVPRAHLAMGSMSSGAMLVLMECLEGAVPSGVYFGAGNPNNWGVELPPTGAGTPTPEHLSLAAFKLYARLHGTHWRSQALLSMSWLRGSDWAQGDGEQTWRAAMRMASDAWAELSAARRDGTSGVAWDPHVVACLDASFAKAKWDSFLEEQAKRPLSLVHGDCHPHNVLLLGERLCLVDFEMVGVGSPAQELGQFLISHMEPDRRRAVERGLVEAYHTELVSTLRARGITDAYSFDACWSEYVAGGAGRWAWFVPYLAKAMPPLGQFFHDQLAAFLHDHIPDPSQAPIPRV